MPRDSVSGVIMGAGVTGLAASIASGWAAYEAATEPGGICRSYYVRPETEERLSSPPEDNEAYRFEIGGGHWIFEGNHWVMGFIEELTRTTRVERRSAVYFPNRDLLVPYPLQNHLGLLGKDLALHALWEITRPHGQRPSTLDEWLCQRFGQTLCELFFAPFHESYTAGLWRKIAPRDSYKTPLDINLVLAGMHRPTGTVGYNAVFRYPGNGLDALTRAMASRGRVIFAKRAIAVDAIDKVVAFDDGSAVRYNQLLSTVPLSVMMNLTGIEIGAQPDPHTSVLVLNIGARKGRRCPSDHWVYVPQSTSGFHRVGFYSNVDVSFLPRSFRDTNQYVSLYVERSFRPTTTPDSEQIVQYIRQVTSELRDWGFVEDVDTVHPNWVPVAYTWSWPGSTWTEQALDVLRQHQIHQAGRFAAWKFQGIAESIQEGFALGNALAHGEAG